MRNNTAVLIPLENVGSFARAPMPCLSTATDICFYWLSRSPPAIDAVVADLDFNRLVEEHYQPLYRFAFSLSRNEPDACDLVQQAFARWAAKGHQLRDTSKAKTWLFTTLYREFLSQCRRAAHLLEPDENTEFVEPPDVSPSAARAIDAASVQWALHRPGGTVSRAGHSLLHGATFLSRDRGDPRGADRHGHVAYLAR